MDESDQSSEMSDVDPQALIDSLKNIDDLDADLFSGSKAKNAKKPEKVPSVKSSLKQPTLERKKKVSFHNSTELGKDDFGFDPDDPLGDLLPDDDDDFIFDREEPKTLVSKKTSKISEPPKMDKQVKEEKLFDDNDDDILDALGLEDEKPKSKERSTSRSALDDLLGFRSEAEAPKPKEKQRNLRFDKDGNFIKENSSVKQPAKPTATEPDDLSFGGYMPSTSSGKGRRSKETKKPELDSGSFLDFLNSDIDAHSKSPSKKDSGTSRSRSMMLSSDPVSASDISGRPKSSEFLGLGKEIDLGEVEVQPKRPSSSSVLETKKSTLTDPPPVTTKEVRTPPFQGKGSISGDINQLEIAPVFTQPPPVALHSEPIYDPPSSSNIFLDDPVKPRVARASRRSRDEDLLSSSQRSVPPKQPTPLSESKPWVPNVMQELTPAIRSQSLEVEVRVQNLENQLDHARGLLHQVQLGHQADLDLAKQAYDGRVEILQRSLGDVRTRAERESESIRESYAARLDAVRQQVREHAVEAAGHDLVEQEEIKRLRDLHLQALEDMRLDHDQQVARVKRCHGDEIEALKSSTVYVRNMDSMMDKVNESTQQLQKLTAKYESAFHSMTQQSENMSSANKHLSSVIQNQLQQMQRQNEETQKNLQQTVSRLEGTISEMNRRFEEQQYRMQSEQSRLQSAQASLELEKKHLMQQVQIEREQARKSQNEAVDLQRNLQREAKEDRERWLRREEEMRVASRSAEEAREAEVALAAQRDREARSAMESLARNRSNLAERSERMVAVETKLHLQKEEYERRMATLKSNEQSLEERRESLVMREKDLRENEEKNAKRINESDQALTEVKRVEREHESRLNELHVQSEDLARQRQLLAEERKLIAEEKLDIIQNHHAHPKSTPPPANIVYDLTPTKLTRADLVSSVPVNTAPIPLASNPATVLWSHTAMQDQNYLEDEKFFLEALKHTPYHGTKS
ncbi:fas-binding factor 1 homolog isoform X2 [Ciona intestinalis]